MEINKNCFIFKELYKNHIQNKKSLKYSMISNDDYTLIKKWVDDKDIAKIEALLLPGSGSGVKGENELKRNLINLFCEIIKKEHASEDDENKVFLILKEAYEDYDREWEEFIYLFYEKEYLNEKTNNKCRTNFKSIKNKNSKFNLLRTENNVYEKIIERKLIGPYKDYAYITKKHLKTLPYFFVVEDDGFSLTEAGTKIIEKIIFHDSYEKLMEEHSFISPNELIKYFNIDNNDFMKNNKKQ